MKIYFHDFPGHEELRYLEKLTLNKSDGPNQLCATTLEEISRPIPFPSTKIFTRWLQKVDNN